VSSNESEPVLVTGFAVTAAEQAMIALSAGTTMQDKSLANVSSATPQAPAKVRVRGFVTLTATAEILTVKLRQGNGTGGAQVMTSVVGPATVNIGIPFDFVDSAPIGNAYTVTITGAAACTASGVASITAYDA
jgi:hypothetical protein